MYVAFHQTQKRQNNEKNLNSVVLDLKAVSNTLNKKWQIVFKLFYPSSILLASSCFHVCMYLIKNTAVYANMQEYNYMLIHKFYPQYTCSCCTFSVYGVLALLCQQWACQVSKGGVRYVHHMMNLNLQTTQTFQHALQ